LEWRVSCAAVCLLLLLLLLLIQLLLAAAAAACLAAVAAAVAQMPAAAVHSVQCVKDTLIRSSAVQSMYMDFFYAAVLSIAVPSMIIG
jgi:hypothetical protein